MCTAQHTDRIYLHQVLSGQNCGLWTTVVAESETQRVPSRVSQTPRQSSHIDCPEGRWMDPFPGEFHNYCFFLPRGIKSNRRYPGRGHTQFAMQNTLFTVLSLSIWQWIFHSAVAHKDWQTAVLLSEQHFVSDRNPHVHDLNSDVN